MLIVSRSYHTEPMRSGATLTVAQIPVYACATTLRINTSQGNSLLDALRY